MHEVLLSVAVLAQRYFLCQYFLVDPIIELNTQLLVASLVREVTVYSNKTDFASFPPYSISSHHRFSGCSPMSALSAYCFGRHVGDLIMIRMDYFS